MHQIPNLNVFRLIFAKSIEAPSCHYVGFTFKLMKTYNQTSNIRCNKSQNLNVSRLAFA